MKNEKIRKFGIGTAYQPSLCLIGGRNAPYSDNRSSDDNVWCIKNSGISLCSTSQREQILYSGSRNFCSIYSQTFAQFDQPGQEVCKFPRYVNWQSGQNSAGRFFSKEGSCPKQGDKLKHPIAMIGYVSKNSPRFTIFLSQTITVIFLIIFLNQ